VSGKEPAPRVWGGAFTNAGGVKKILPKKGEETKVGRVKSLGCSLSTQEKQGKNDTKQKKGRRKISRT